VYIGLSANGSREAHELSLLGNRVLLVAPSQSPDHVSVGHRSFDLRKDSEMSAFASSLGLSAARADALSAAIAGAFHDSRDMVGQLAKIWADAERTHALPGRVVLSGEHAGRQYWARHGHSMIFATNIQALAAVFPRAAGAVQDLYLSACNGRYDMADWPEVFPHLTTIWGYLRTAPSLLTGAKTHIGLWDRATRGNQQRIDRLVAKNTRYGDNVAVWSRFYGFQTGVVESIETLLVRVTAAESTFQSFFVGDSVVVNHQAGPLREYYDNIQALLQGPDLSAGQRSTWEPRSQVTIRLIYFDTIRARFQQTYATQIAAGYAAVGLPAPNFSVMDRKSALASIAAFEAKLAQSTPAAATQLRPMLTDGLRALGSRYIPLNWMG
jgi:hypothetical protein